MSTAASLPKLTLSARLGASADIALRLETTNLRFAAIGGMSKSAPLRVTAPNHGILDQWYAAIVDAKGMTQMNAVDANSIRDAEFHQVTLVDADHVDFNGISSALFSTYTSGGYLAYYAPLDLSAYTGARMDIKRKVGGAVELSLSTTAGTMSIDAATSTVSIALDETDLSALSARDYVFDIELIRVGGIDAICSAESVFSVLPEVTTSA